jgi:hypothetical protein
LTFKLDAALGVLLKKKIVEDDAAIMKVINATKKSPTPNIWDATDTAYVAMSFIPGIAKPM